jgi:hypothetical protein
MSAQPVIIGQASSSVQQINQPNNKEQMLQYLQHNPVTPQLQNLIMGLMQ